VEEATKGAPAKRRRGAVLKALVFVAFIVAGIYVVRFIGDLEILMRRKDCLHLICVIYWLMVVIDIL